jgi:hypothetical protein
MIEEIAPLPSMDGEGLKFFQEVVKRSQCYVEYGSGGSTAYAVTVAHVPIVISVESDLKWHQKLVESLDGVNSRLYLHHCDIGEVREWGAPKNRDRIDDFWKYMVSPWRVARLNHVVPDTVLIDGRFRVASFLFSLLNARAGTLFLFDDYFDRPYYFVVEEFCRLHERHGRMGVFVASMNFSFAEICEKIAQYSIVWE